MKLLWFWLVVFFLSAAGSAPAQVLVANDDAYGIPYGRPLVVDVFGVLDNDLLDGEAAGEMGATAELVVDVTHGTLALNPDGSFSYSPGADFDGSDQFVYRARFGSITQQATVALSACTGGPDVFTCWNESAYLAKIAEIGYAVFQEGFEDDLSWGDARTPLTMPSVSSQGIRWQSNHPDAPASNELSTSSGPARSGQWAVFDPDHGYAAGTPTECDVDVPPEHCLYHDGVTGARELGFLHGVGAYFSGIFGANVAIVLDGGVPMGGGRIGAGFQFFGAIDTRPAGFTRFEFRELDGKIGQALFIFADDFRFAVATPTAASEISSSRVFFAGASPNPSGGNTTLSFSLPSRAGIRLAIYDRRGRLVRVLAHETLEAGFHSLGWDGRDRDGRMVAAGVYFGRLAVQGNGAEEVLVQKIAVFR